MTKTCKECKKPWQGTKTCYFCGCGQWQADEVIAWSNKLVPDWLDRDARPAAKGLEEWLPTTEFIGGRRCDRTLDPLMLGELSTSDHYMSLFRNARAMHDHEAANVWHRAALAAQKEGDNSVEGFLGRHPCRLCGSTHFGSTINDDGSLTRHCHGYLADTPNAHVPCRHKWHERDDAEYGLPVDGEAPD